MPKETETVGRTGGPEKFWEENTAEEFNKVRSERVGGKIKGGPIGQKKGTNMMFCTKEGGECGCWGGKDLPRPNRAKRQYANRDSSQEVTIFKVKKNRKAIWGAGKKARLDKRWKKRSRVVSEVPEPTERTAIMVRDSGRRHARGRVLSHLTGDNSGLAKRGRKPCTP